MEALNHEVQDLVTRFKKLSFSLSNDEREKVRLEKERIFSLNEKLYKKTAAFKHATPEELKKYKRNTNKLEDLKFVLIADGASE